MLDKDIAPKISDRLKLDEVNLGITHDNKVCIRVSGQLAPAELNIPLHYNPISESYFLNTRSIKKEVCEIINKHFDRSLNKWI